ncbi:uncharacterized protein LOC111332386 isoform X1 [Stylophora pistillata]|uniref:Leucine-zipper-like transcriptional regulator 1 n=2 Tax=Stylophora pistillata TaxID=50429 RepID=A0A2B4SWZ5_STYPI|nr:uncharacterized protein LOC111332386 isoform X1 [Stylophora pistillata]PFX33856.1 Leucine-zipper-like transcriptional regulator 1 [Stylophora pistillata]
MGQEFNKQVQPGDEHVVLNKSAVQPPLRKHLYKRDPLNRFSDSEVQSMVHVYQNLAALSPRDKYIDRKTFIHYFPLDGMLAERLFVAFDKDRNGHIDRDEFLGGLALCLRGSTEERGQIIFDMFNLDGTDGVSVSEISVMLKSVLSAAVRIIHVRDGQTPDGDDCVALTDVDNVVENLVSDAVSQCDQSANVKLTKAEFVSWMRRHPLVVDSVFQHSSIKDKQFNTGLQHDRGQKSHRPPGFVITTHQGARHTELLSQTWVDGLQEGGDEEEPVFNGSYANAEYLWSPVFPASLSMPWARSRHSVCVWGGGVFVYGGRGTRGTLKDFWRYDIANNVWKNMPVEGEFRPPCLQEHTALTCKGNMYIFGGEFTSTNETPLWTFNFRSGEWTKQAARSWGPGTRRSHTAVIHESSMFVFGGYIDMRGASDELWQYELDTARWIRVKWKGEGPSPRYSHSAAVGAGGMWVYGGLEGLQSRNDLWRWSFVSHSWTRMKSRGGPPALFGHSAIKVGEGMLIFGGETTDGALQNTIWRFDLGARTWSTVRPRGDISPPVRSCFSVGVVSSSAFHSIRPSTAHSAPPCTPMSSGFLGEERLNSKPTTTRPESWCESVARWDMSSASLGSLDSTAPFYNSVLSVGDNKRSQPRPASMFSSEVYENSRGMTLSDDSLHPNPNQNTAQKDHQLKAQTLPAQGVTSGKKSRVYSQELLNVNSPVSADLRRNISRPFACVLVLGGKTRTQADLGKSIDIWRCDIDPEKRHRTERVEKITVSGSSHMTTPTPPYSQLEEHDDVDTESVGSDLVLADLSDSDTRSVDFLLDDFRLDVSHGVPKVSV